MSGFFEFDAVMQQVKGIDAGFIEFPFDAHTEFGKKGRNPQEPSFKDFRNAEIRN